VVCVCVGLLVPSVLRIRFRFGGGFFLLSSAGFYSHPLLSRSSEDDDHLCKEYVTVSLHYGRNSVHCGAGRRALVKVPSSSPRRADHRSSPYTESSFAVSHVCHLCISSFRSTSNLHHLPRAGQGGMRAACAHNRRTSPKPL